MWSTRTTVISAPGRTQIAQFGRDRDCHADPRTAVQIGGYSRHRLEAAATFGDELLGPSWWLSTLLAGVWRTASSQDDPIVHTIVAGM
jgi:hypothetical protein